MEPLFIQPELVFAKTAGEVDLPEDPNMWPQEILQELFKQVPYIADFQPHVVMQKVDSERGYGIGQVELSNKSEAQTGTNPEMAAAAGIRSVRIPIIIKGKKLSPFDLLINDTSKVLPLTESRLRQSLFRPQAFDVTSQTPGDTSMIGQLYPPYRQNYGFGGGGVSFSAGMAGKTASALEGYLEKSALWGRKPVPTKKGEITPTPEHFKSMGLNDKDAQSMAKGWPNLRNQLNESDLSSFHEQFAKHEASKKKTASIKFAMTDSLLNVIAPTLNQSDVDGFFNKLASSVGLQAAYSRNRLALEGPLSLLANLEPFSIEKRAGVLQSHLKPTVVQLLKTDTGYLMKTASHRYWCPSTVELTRREVIQAFGEKVALAADEAGQVTMAEGASEKTEAPPVEQPELVEDSGLYKVIDEHTGKELIGFVVPNLLDIDGTLLPLALFTNGSHSAVQPDIMGIPAGSGATLPNAEPSGAGAFYSYTPEGKLQATIPLDLTEGSYAMPGEPPVMVGQTFDGRPVEISIQPNIQTVMQTSEGRMLIPESWQWTPLGASDSVALVGQESGDEEGEESEAPSEEGQEPKAQEEKKSHVILRGDHDCFSFSGPAVEKLAEADTQMVSLDQAMFLLAGLGVDLGQGIDKLAQSLNAAQRVQVGRLIKTAAEQDVEAHARAQEYAHIALQLRQDLVKEAAEIPDPTSVDTILSLGFLNPENLLTFVSYLPTLEDSQTKLCDLLLATRAGLSDISDTALERAIRCTEEVIEGLKVIAFQGN